MLDRQNNPKAPVKNKRGETTALEDYENYKPTVEDIKNSETTFDSQLEDYYFDNNVYNHLTYGGQVYRTKKLNLKETRTQF